MTFLGGITLSSIGSIRVHAYQSYAKLPLENVAVSITMPDGTPIALRTTDRSGLIAPVAIPVPDRSESLTPDPPERPFTLVNIYARLKGYEQVEAESVQLFADTVTDQELEMIPLSEMPAAWNQTEVFYTPPQNL